MHTPSALVRICLVLLFAPFLLPLISKAAEIEGSSSGVFLDPMGPPGMVTSGVGTKSFSWGDPANLGTGPSNLTFSGNGTIGVDLDELFSLGILDYFNGTIVGGTGADSVDLEVALTLTKPSGIAEQVVLPFTLLNTVNVPGDPQASADFVRFPPTFPSVSFMVGNVEHFLILEGFGDIEGSGFTDETTEFHVLEADSASAELVGRVLACTKKAGFIKSLEPVPGPDGGDLLFKPSISRNVSNEAVSVALQLCNPNQNAVKGIACMMANTVPPDVEHDRWDADFDGSAWSCTQSGKIMSPPSYHFGCKKFSIDPGAIWADFFDDSGVLPVGEKRLAPYIDFLIDGNLDSKCSLPAPDGVKGAQQFLVPLAASGTYVNVWTIYGGIMPLSPLGCDMDWPTGNWFTMGNPDTYPAVLNGTVRDAPTGSSVTIHFPPGSPTPERTFLVPPSNPSNPTCLGVPVEISEPFIIPPEPAVLTLELEIPEECSDLREGTTVRFEAEAVADIGSPVFAAGDFIVEHSGTCVVDNMPPQIERLITTPRGDGLLDVHVAAIDEISTPLEALLHIQVDGGPEQQIRMNFGDPPVVGDSVFFHQTIGPFPQGSVIEIAAEVFDDVGNPGISPMIIPGDLDGDGDVDRDDLNILLADRNKTVQESACGSPCDLDGDGMIASLDARKLTFLCTRPRCATE